MEITPLPLFFLYLVVPLQLLFWVAMWFIVGAFDRRRLRRAQARGQRSAPHWNEVVIVLGIIFTLLLLFLYAVSWVRPLR